MSVDTSLVEFDRAHTLAMYKSLTDPEQKKKAKLLAERAARRAERVSDTGL